MAVITKLYDSDEKTWQGEFYRNLFGNDYDGITVDRSTDGYTRGILFEHKTNIQSYGESKALGQALIYLTRFNRDGVPVPAKICLVGQEEQRCYIYDTQNYMHIVNDIPKYANMKASGGIPGFSAGIRTEMISFDMSSLRGMEDVLKFVQQAPQTVKVDINVHNVYGWSTYYYDHAAEYKQKPEKKKFFEELRKPVGTLEAFINPWTGIETDFKFIMDMLNDPQTQKELGAFYTPTAYCKKASELVKIAIERVPDGNDYVIIDRCAGGGNLEMYLDDGDEDILSHCILSTYELHEWMVLKDRYQGRVRYIIPPVPANPSDLPELNDKGFLSGANALTRDIIDNPEIRKYLDNPKCTIILFENPPYIEGQSIEFHKSGGTGAEWKGSFVVQEMKKEVPGVASNDKANAFIWSAFKYFLRQPTDSYVVFSPIKYWKSQALVNKRFLQGFAFNRIHFHGEIEACVSCILWSNEDAKERPFELYAYDIDDSQKIVQEGPIKVKRVHTLYSGCYYDKREDPTDVVDGYNVICNNKGEEEARHSRYVIPRYNTNIIGYLCVAGSGFDNPDLQSNLTRLPNYRGHGFFLRSDNFTEKLPMFAASRYIRYNPHWTERAMVMKSADKSAQFFADVSSGVANDFLCKCLIFGCFEPQNHCRSLHGSDGRFYRNELCFDNLDGKTTLARQKLDEFIANGYELSGEEAALFEKWDTILKKIHETDEYNSEYTYGLYQIDEEINVKIQQGVKKDGTPNMVTKYGDLNNLIKDLKGMVKDYYLNNLVDTLFEYEFLK